MSKLLNKMILNPLSNKAISIALDFFLEKVDVQAKNLQDYLKKNNEELDQRIFTQIALIYTVQEFLEKSFQEKIEELLHKK